MMSRDEMLMRLDSERRMWTRINDNLNRDEHATLTFEEWLILQIDSAERDKMKYRDRLISIKKALIGIGENDI